MTTKVLIIAGDVLPLPGYATTGAGLRAWSLGQGLQSHGFEVTFSMPEFHCRPESRGPEHELSWHPHDRERPLRLVKPDVVVVCHWPAMPRRRLEIPVVLDLHGPHLMERRFWDPDKARQGVVEKIAAFRHADFFTCAGERQRFYFFNWLLLAGFDLSSALISVIPVSLSPELPPRTAVTLTETADPIIVFGGMFLPWQDPVEALETLLESMTECERGSLHLFGGPHPLVQHSSGRFAVLMDTMRRHPRVSIHEPISHDDLITFYCQAHLAFDLMAPNQERELAFTTRTVEYLWCGLPVIYNDYAELSPTIARFNAGWTLKGESPDYLRRDLNQILKDPHEIVRRSENARRLVSESLTWNRATLPLANYCRHPTRNEPGVSLYGRSSIPESAPEKAPPTITQDLARLWQRAARGLKRKILGRMSET